MILNVGWNNDWVKSSYGFFHVYAFTMTFGIFIVVLASYYKAKIRRVPYNPIIFSAPILIIFGLLGASFFGKLNATGLGQNPKWYELFYFWQSGMSIHGAISVGIIAWFVSSWFLTRKNKVSAWVYFDVILPNILLGQAIGRWGNFFNHELLGQVVSYDSLKWLPAFIRDNCFKLINGSPEMINNQIVYRAPIFLYESFANFMLFLIITFIVPNIGKWCGPKPYKNKGFKYLYSFKYNLKTIFKPYLRNDKNLNFKDLWNYAYYYDMPSLTQVQKAKPRDLNQVYNKHKFWITKTGVEAGMYVAGYNLIRLILETQRQPDNLFIHYDRGLDYTIIGLLSFLGVLMMVWSTFIGPKYFRKVGWQYEKTYLDFTDINSWPLQDLAKFNLTYGVDNNLKNYKKYLAKEISKIIGYDFTVTNLDQYFKIKQAQFNTFNDLDSSLSLIYKIEPTELSKSKLNISKTAKFYLDFKINLNKVWSDKAFSKWVIKQKNKNNIIENIQLFWKSDFIKTKIQRQLQLKFKNIKKDLSDDYILQFTLNKLFKNNQQLKKLKNSNKLVYHKYNFKANPFYFLRWSLKASK